MKFKYMVVNENNSESSILGIVEPMSRKWQDFDIFLKLLQYKFSVPITQLWYKLGS